MHKKILVIGAAGFVGAPIARQLQKDGFTVRALVRNADKARQLLGSDMEIVTGNFDDEAFLEKALEGVDGVNISVPWQAELQVVQAVSAILSRQKRNKVLITYISGTTVLPENKGYPMVDMKLQAEAALIKSGVDYTILKPSWFMDALALFVRDGRATIFGKQTQAYFFLSIADFACAVSKAYQTESAIRQSVVLNGPQSMLMADALQQYCDTLHLGIKPASMPIWFGKFLAAMLKSNEMRDFVQMMAYFETSPKVSTPNKLEQSLLPQTASFAAWLKSQN